jgi:hypothetical protein
MTIAEAARLAATNARLLPMQQVLGSGMAVGAATVVGLQVEDWERLLDAIDAATIATDESLYDVLEIGRMRESMSAADRGWSVALDEIERLRALIA